MTSRILIVEAWDGEKWVPRTAKYTGKATPSTTLEFTPVTTRKIRVRQPSSMGSPHYKNVMWLTEIEFFKSKE